MNLASPKQKPLKKQQESTSLSKDHHVLFVCSLEVSIDLDLSQRLGILIL